MTVTANNTLTARFNSICPRCDEKIEKGSLLEKTQVGGKKVYAHVGCEEKQVPASAYKTNAKDGIKKCPRCSEAIEEGQDLVKWVDGPRVKVRGKQATQWVHAHCGTIAAEPVTNATTTADTADVETVLKRLLEETDFSQIDSEIDSKLDSFKDSMAQRMASAAEMILEQAEAKAKETIENLAPRTIEIKKLDGTTQKLDGHQHPAFERILQLAQMRKNIFLPGPAGCGKSYIASQIAKSLDLPFYFISCSMGMSEGQITGRLLPMGEDGRFEYVRSDFVKAYEEGGVFLLDEIDASDPNVLVSINAALANGVLSIPNRPENPVAKKHEDFILIAAANTFGRGADRLYCGRNELDEATMDRFRIGTVPMDYDTDLERVLCPNDELRNELQRIREKAAEARLERIVSTRFMKDGAEMIQFGWSVDDVCEQLTQGWSEDEIRKIR